MIGSELSCIVQIFAFKALFLFSKTASIVMETVKQRIYKVRHSDEDDERMMSDTLSASVGYSEKRHLTVLEVPRSDT